MSDLRGKHIVITGASAGIGAQLAHLCGQRKARVTLAARRVDRLEQVASRVRAAGKETISGPSGEAQVFRCDVTDRDQVQELVERCRERFGEIDVWVNNAGAGMRHNLLAATPEDMHGMYALNCLSALWAYQALVPRWLAQWMRTDGTLAQAHAADGHAAPVAGRRPGPVLRQIIDICSLGGKLGFAYSGGYAAAKHALSAIGDALRQELALFGPPADGIVITTVYPGPTTTDFSASALDRTDGRAVRATASMRAGSGWLRRRLGSAQTPDQLCEAIAGVMLKRVYTLYPHRWMNPVVMLGTLAPGYVLAQLRREAEKQARAEAEHAPPPG